MTVGDMLRKKIEELKQSEQSINEINKIEAEIGVLEECEAVLDNEDELINYDFINVIELLSSKDIDTENLAKMLGDIKNVILVRKELNMNEEDIPFDETQVATIARLKENIIGLKNKFLEEIETLKVQRSSSSEETLSKLEELIKIFDGTGKRKYFDEEMIKVFFETFDLDEFSKEEMSAIIDAFYSTRNLSTKQIEERPDFDTVLALYKEFITKPKFAELLKKHEVEITTVIDLENTREILNFFKQKGILNKFAPKALLEISLYGSLEYIVETAYQKIMSSNKDDIPAFFKEDLASVWVKEKNSDTRRGYFRRGRLDTSEGSDDTLYSQCHTIDIDGLRENIGILKENIALFDEGFDPEDMGSNIPLKSIATWSLKKNIQLLKIMGFGTIYTASPSSIAKGDLENKFHLAIELGLLNPPLTDYFLRIDKNIVKNAEFQKARKKENVSNQSIRNYFARCSSKLSNISIDKFALLFYKLKNKKYLDFYNEFFSSKKAGQSTITSSSDPIFKKYDEDIVNDREKLEAFIMNNFTTEWYSEFIASYDEYDTTITDYDEEKKKEEYTDYVNSFILDDPLIQKLETNNRVMDICTVGDTTTEVPNEYVYMFGDRIISRYKVLHNASILRNEYGSLNEDMLMASIVRNSFIDYKSFEKIYNTVKSGERRTI